MLVEYWLDTNAYIEPSRRFYAPDIAPGFWRVIEEQASRGVIQSSREVFRELMYNCTQSDGSKDRLGTWVSERERLIFVEPDKMVQECMTDVADYVQRTYESFHVRKLLSGADPWVIAHAKAYGGVVVTLETREDLRKKIKEAKIPDICDHFGITCIPPYEMLRRLNVALTLG